LKQVQQWLPVPAMSLLNTVVENGASENIPVNVVDWAFQFDGGYDGARFQELAHSKDTWYGSSYWTGPDWTRVGKDWQHSGEKTSSVRRFTAPRDGKVTLSGSVFKADTNGGDGVRVSIRHNADTVWQQDIEANDARGVDPALTLDVRAGDRIRFAVHRRNAIACDTTHWDPVICYADGAVFRASDGFGEAPRDGWSYEMEVEAATELPRLYSFDRHFCLQEQPLSSGTSVVLDSASSLPLFILADDKDASGIAGAVINACPWQIEVALSETGLLSLRIRNGAGGDLPVVAAGAYKGNWMNGAAQLEGLRRSETASPDLGSFRGSIQAAFNEVLGAVEPRAAAELDLWAAVQWDWHKQDNLAQTPEGYEAAIASVAEKTGKLAADLGVTCALPSPAQEPCLNYLRAHALRRKTALDNPLMQFGRLMFCKRVPTSYSHLVMQYYGWRARPGGGLFVLDKPGYSFAAHDIFNGTLKKGSILEPRLSYDATRTMFSYVDNAGRECDPLQLNNAVDEGFYHVYEANIDGTGLRQITRGPYDDLMPAYLPDGGIVFSSTRREGYARCFGGQFSPRWHVYTLHRMDADGNNLHTLSYHDTNEWFPVVSNTGLILYSRWDYIDRDAVTHQTLWATRPDGTNPMAVWGNATPKPHCTFQIQPIPNSPKIAFTAAAHHSIAAGPIVVVDPDKGSNGQEALTRITPGPFPEAESMNIPDYYESPWPLSEKYFLAGYSPWPLVWEPGANLPNALGIYLVDVFGNRELIYRDPVIGSTNPCPLVPRPVPPVLSSALPENAPDQGEVLVSDVYQGLTGIERGTVTEMRVIQIFPKSTPIGGAPPIGLAAEENGRAVLGEVPVEADGSVRVTVPARKPILFQLLDKDGMAVQTMRSLTYLQPGEKVSCVGCHENRMNTPVKGIPRAARRDAAAITPKEFENEPFSYMRVVQPILDAHCIRCHSGAEPKGKKDLTGAPLKGFNTSYWSLCGDTDFAGPNTNPETAAAALVPRFGMRNQVQMTPPGGLYGARGSRLIAMLRKGHNDVELSPEELRRLAQWIDCNAIFYGVNLPEDQVRLLQGERLPMPQLQ
jgi:hypothetical protein